MNRDAIIFTGMEKTRTISRPAGAARLRTFLDEHGYNVEVVDYFGNFSARELELACDKYIGDKTIFVGVSITFLYDFEKINHIFKYIKEKYPKVMTVIGGNESTLDGIETQYVDRIIWVYAEEAVLHFMKFYQKSIVGRRLDDLEWVDYRGTKAINAELKYKNDDKDLTIKWLDTDLIKHNFLPIEISRGCIFRCRFCQFPLLGKKKNDYIRHVDNLSDELRRNYEQFGVTNYWFNDDTFNDNIVKLEYVADAIAKSGVNITYTAFLRADLLHAFPESIQMLGDTGLVAATFGLETLHPEAKKAIGKGMDNEKQFEAIKQLKRYKPTYTYTGMIAGLPGEPVSSMMASQRWLIEQNFEVFDNWDWWTLHIRKQSMTRLSEFETEYLKWGYTDMTPEQLKDVVNEVGDRKFAKNDFLSYWQNKHVNWFTAKKIVELFNHETERARIAAGKSIYGNSNKGVSINHDVFELVGFGVDIKDIIDGTFDKNVLNQRISDSYLTIQDYKKLKLGL
jgi:radical SAM superfamily enzyme YgiQ (UPF0313 family)